eukprot:TRINITY_DN112619_c0_g1_i1.p1 TRINITY_DN112619_c0_g1~~TRINITY_DN112619_c0_g1_i1.p1  ORF type:complete len:411 (-),score=42.63 TRINITY_DN112619_c0_g1_i1:57-1289(-)
MQSVTERGDAPDLSSRPSLLQVELRVVSQPTSMDLALDERWLVFRCYEPLLEILRDSFEFGCKVCGSCEGNPHAKPTTSSIETAETQGIRLEETESETDKTQADKPVCLDAVSFWSQIGTYVFVSQQSAADLPTLISSVKASAIFGTSVLALKYSSVAILPHMSFGTLCLIAGFQAWRFHPPMTLEDNCITQQSCAAVCATLGVLHLATGSVLVLRPEWLPVASGFRQAVVVQALSNTLTLPALIHCVGRLAGRRSTGFMEASMSLGAASSMFLLASTLGQSNVLLGAAAMSVVAMKGFMYRLSIHDAANCSNINAKVVNQVGNILAAGTLTQFVICLGAHAYLLGEGQATCFLLSSEYVMVHLAVFQTLSSRFAVNAAVAHREGLIASSIFLGLAGSNATSSMPMPLPH